MNENFLIAVDLEGVHEVVGEPYCGLTKDSKHYELAVKNAEKEVNVLIKGLFDAGAKTVGVWDNHAGGGNLNFDNVDKRAVKLVNLSEGKYVRLKVADSIKFDGIIFLGYHPKEGSLNGVLAHSYSSKQIQYYKINGVSVGELEIDSYAGAERGIAPLMCVSDSVGVEQALGISSDMLNVITKYGKGRNSATLRGEDEVLNDIYNTALKCRELNITPKKLKFPALLEVRYTRSEYAQEIMEKVKNYGQEVRFGEDTHVLVCELKSFSDLETFL